MVVQAADGSLGNELLHVAGILKGVGESLDRSLALIHRADFEELFVFPGKVHEIVLNSRGTDRSRSGPPRRSFPPPAGTRS